MTDLHRFYCTLEMTSIYGLACEILVLFAYAQKPTLNADARGLMFGLSPHILSYIVYLKSVRSGETARMHRLV